MNTKVKHELREPTKDATGHSPLPWIASYGERLSDGSDCRVIECEEGSIAEMMCPADVEQANAALIVRAVNNHYALVEALRELREMFFVDAKSGANVVDGEVVHVDNEEHPWIPGARAPEAIAKIDAALAAAQE